MILSILVFFFLFFFSSRRRHTRLQGDWSQTCALPISVGHEANHAAALRESVGVTHREDRPVLEARQNALRSVSLGPTDEQDVAGLDLVHAVVAPDLESPPSQALITHRLVQDAPERIISENADHERRVGLGKGLGWPLDELREVE